MSLALSEVMSQYGYNGPVSGGHVDPLYCGTPGGYVGQGNNIYDRFGGSYRSGYRRADARKRLSKAGSRRGGYDRSRDYRRRYY